MQARGVLHDNKMNIFAFKIKDLMTMMFDVSLEWNFELKFSPKKKLLIVEWDIIGSYMDGCQNIKASFVFILEWRSLHWIPKIHDEHPITNEDLVVEDLSSKEVSNPGFDVVPVRCKEEKRIGVKTSCIA